MKVRNHFWMIFPFVLSLVSCSEQKPFVKNQNDLDHAKQESPILESKPAADRWPAADELTKTPEPVKVIEQPATNSLPKSKPISEVTSELVQESKLDVENVQHTNVQEKVDPSFATWKPQDLGAVDIKFERFSELSLSSGISYQKLAGTDVSNGSRATLFSTESYGLDLRWTQNWSQRFSTYFDFNFLNYNFQEISNRSLVENSLNGSRVYLGAKYHFSENLKLNFSLGYGAQLYLYAPDDTSLRIDRANTLLSKTQVDYLFANLEPFEFSLHGGIRLVMPSDVDVYRSKFGISGNTGLKISQTLKSGNKIKAMIDIEHGRLTTDSVEQTQDNLTFRLGMEWRLE